MIIIIIIIILKPIIEEREKLDTMPFWSTCPVKIKANTNYIRIVTMPMDALCIGKVRCVHHAEKRVII